MSGTENLVKVAGIMKKEGDVAILKDIFFQNRHIQHTAAKLGLGRSFVFQHDSKPKLKLLLVKKDLQETKVNVTDWPGQGITVG